MKNLSFFLLIIFTALIFAQTAQAKILPQASKGIKQTTAVKSKNTGFGVSPRLRRDRKALIVYFSGLNNVKSAQYTLTYGTSIQQEGVIGSLNLKGSPNLTQELLFGTCSKNVCTYHKGINNARLEVSYTGNSGKKYMRKYKIKV